jgi:hypothetical protein
VDIGWFWKRLSVTENTAGAVELHNLLRYIVQPTLTYSIAIRFGRDGDQILSLIISVVDQIK